MLLCTNGGNRLSGKSDNDVESVNNDEFFGCLFNQSEPKKDAAAKRIEGFLSAVPAKKTDDNSFVDAALKNCSSYTILLCPRALQLKGFSAVLGTANLNPIPQPHIPQNSNRWSETQISKFAVRLR